MSPLTLRLMFKRLLVYSFCYDSGLLGLLIVFYYFTSNSDYELTLPVMSSLSFTSFGVLIREKFDINSALSNPVNKRF